MEITLKLFASLGDYLPHEHNGRQRQDNELPVDLPEGTTVQAVIDEFRLPPRMAHLVCVNGVFIPPSQRATKQLVAGDALAIWPPVAGG
jgi:thiamine biosynthesis protein ThiS